MPIYTRFDGMQYVAGDDKSVSLNKLLPGDASGAIVDPESEHLLLVEFGGGVVQMGKCSGTKDESHTIYPHYALRVPAGTWFNVVNVGEIALEYYIVGPPAQNTNTNR